MWSRLRLLRGNPAGPQDQAFVVYRTHAEPRCLDLPRDPNDRPAGSIWGDAMHDPKTGEIEKPSVHGGIESVTDIEWVVMENVLFTSQLAIFDQFSDIEHPIVNNKNKLTGKVNSYITAMFEFELVYDDVVSRQVQLRQGISLGLSYNLF